MTSKFDRWLTDQDAWLGPPEPFGDELDYGDPPEPCNACGYVGDHDCDSVRAATPPLPVGWVLDRERFGILYGVDNELCRFVDCRNPVGFHLHTPDPAVVETVVWAEVWHAGNDVLLCEDCAPDGRDLVWRDCWPCDGTGIIDDDDVCETCEGGGGWLQAPRGY